MSLRWEDERYVRLFVRDSPHWLLGPWEARAVLPLVLRKLDRAGTLELGEDGLEALAAVVGLPLAVVDAGMAWWLKKQTFEIVDGWLVMPKFLDAQEAAATDAQRARESRARARDQARAATITKRDASVTKRDASVTPGHGASHAVTLNCAVPSPSPPPLAPLAEPPRPRAARKKPSTHCPSPEETAEAVDAWCRAQRIPPASEVAEVARMIEWHQSEGKSRASWLATWQRWQRRAPSFARGPRGIVGEPETPEEKAKNARAIDARQRKRDEEWQRLERERVAMPPALLATVNGGGGR